MPKMGFEKTRLIRECGNHPVTAFGCEFKSEAEYRYACHLEKQREAGEIDEWKYEHFRFEFGDYTTYTPDFKVIGRRIGTQYHEVKVSLTQHDVKRFRLMSEYYPNEYLVLAIPRAPKRGNQKRLFDNCKNYIKEVVYFK